MINVFFELDRLRVALQDQGVDDHLVNSIVAKARKEIDLAVKEQGGAAIDQAVELGVEKRSPEFINELQLDTLNFEIETESGQLDFSEPPRPMLPYLLKNAKPLADGSGVYKVIPIGKSTDKAKISASIIDTQKRITAERAEAARSQEKAVAPSGSVRFRTVTSKQDPSTQWVQPAKDKDFTSEVAAINSGLTDTLDSAIRDIISSYLERF